MARQRSVNNMVCVRAMLSAYLRSEGERQWPVMPAQSTKQAKRHAAIHAGPAAPPEIRTSTSTGCTSGRKPGSRPSLSCSPGIHCSAPASPRPRPRLRVDDDRRSSLDAPRSTLIQRACIRVGARSAAAAHRRQPACRTGCQLSHAATLHSSHDATRRDTLRGYSPVTPRGYTPDAPRHAATLSSGHAPNPSLSPAARSSRCLSRLLGAPHLDDRLLLSAHRHHAPARSAHR
jgi:hypothetical protein